MKKLIILSLAALSLAACSNNKFTIKGKIDGAKNQTIYLEELTLDGINIIDSTELRWRGSFSFSEKTNDYPELYRLRIDNEHIIVAVDSNETIEIKAQRENLAANFTVKNSQNTENIRQLRESNLSIRNNSQSWSTSELNLKIAKHRELAQKIALGNPKSLAAYYAIHQSINGQYYLSPYNKEHLPFWSAVATSFNLYQPNNPRTIELKRATLNAIKQKHIEDNNGEITINNDKIKGYIDLQLPDRAGKIQTLSALEGKLVVIDFTAYSIEQAPAHTLFLRDIHSKYSKSGLEIYQVSLDGNKLFWMEQSQSTPWICVRDNNAPNTVCIATYNVSELPTMFIMNRSGDIIGRFSHADLEKAIIENI